MTDNDETVQQSIWVTIEADTEDEVRAFLAGAADVESLQVRTDELLSTKDLAEEMLMEIVATGTIGGVTGIVNWLRARGLKPRVSKPKVAVPPPADDSD